MKRIFSLATVALLGLSASLVSAGEHCSCITPPTPDCPDCSSPCDHFRLPALFGCEHTHKLICSLTQGDCDERVKAAKKLGSRIHADFCCNPEVLGALVHALQCDTCWKVRAAAAWAISSQHARVPQGVVALYLASKIDPNYMVRDASADALDILILCRRDCYKDMFAAADELSKKIRGYYKPTDGRCVNLLNEFCASFGTAGAVPVEEAPMATPPVEKIPSPKGEPVPTGESK
jgi:hypothetical protein